MLPRALAGHVAGGQARSARPAPVAAAGFTIVDSGDDRSRCQDALASTSNSAVQAGVATEAGASSEQPPPPDATASSADSGAGLPPTAVAWPFQTAVSDPVEADILRRVAAICAGPQQRSTAG